MTEDCECRLCAGGYGPCDGPAQTWIEQDDEIVPMCQECGTYCTELEARGY